jgi:hypothetical protein
MGFGIKCDTKYRMGRRRFGVAGGELGFSSRCDIEGWMGKTLGEEEAE